LTGKVLFIVKKYIIESLGIGYLIAGLKQKGFEVDLIQVECELDVLGYVRQFKPNIICYNIWTGGQQYFYQLNRSLKANYCFTSIFGGAHATFCTEDVLKQSGIDFVVKGEADTALADLCKGIMNGDTKHEHRWFVNGENNTGFYKAGLVNVRTPPQDLDALPKVDRSLLYKYEHNRKNPIRSIMASRGCPFNCSFCFNSQYNEMFEGNRLRFRDMRAVMLEAMDIRIKYPATRYFFFQDDEMGARKKDLQTLANDWQYVVGLPFHAQMRVEYIDDERINLLKKAGCNSITFAMESANEKTRKDVLGKKFSNKKIESAIKVLQKHKMKYRIENMIGIPFCDTIKDMWETYEANKRYKTTMSWASLTQPYPSTELGKRCVTAGLYDNDVDSIPEAFFGETVLVFPLKQKKMLENMQRLFTLLVGLRVSKKLAAMIICLPFTKAYSLIGKKYKEYCFKKLYDL